MPLVFFVFSAVMGTFLTYILNNPLAEISSFKETGFSANLAGYLFFLSVVGSSLLVFVVGFVWSVFHQEATMLEKSRWVAGSAASVLFVVPLVPIAFALTNITKRTWFSSALLMDIFFIIFLIVVLVFASVILKKAIIEAIIERC